MVRRRHGGGYFTILNPPMGTSETKRVAYRSTYVHLALGYPGLKFLPDLQQFRTQYPDHAHRVVNAYEPHEHVYEEPAGRRAPCWRGGGIVGLASSSACSTTGIITARRPPSPTCSGPTPARTARASSAAQGRRRLGVPGLQLAQRPGWWADKRKIEHLDGEARKQVYADLGGTNTPKRKLWQKQMAAGRRGGYYHTYQGQVQEVLPGDGGTVITRISGTQGTLEIPANFIVDATGLEADIREHRVLADLFDHTGTAQSARSPRRRPVVRDHRDAQRPRRMYAWAPRLWWPAGVDTFLGLQYAALRVTDDLAAQVSAPVTNVARSISQWLVGPEPATGPHAFGRIQTRTFALVVVGGLWTIIITPFLQLFVPGGGFADGPAMGDLYDVTLSVLFWVIVLGIGWEFVYHGLQQFRWRRTGRRCSACSPVSTRGSSCSSS